MNTEPGTHYPPVLRFEELNWVASDPLPRDREQSHRLHEPDHMINSIDPVTGRDIGDVTGHPFVVDGDLTIYFESRKSRKLYLETPVNHPFAHLAGTPSEEIDRGG